MKKIKKFDCVQMKWDIQKKIQEEETGLSFEEKLQKRLERILANPITAKIWREAKRSRVPEEYAEFKE